jgi:hypothetical protein
MGSVLGVHGQEQRVAAHGALLVELGDVTRGQDHVPTAGLPSAGDAVGKPGQERQAQVALLLALVLLVHIVSPSARLMPQVTPDLLMALTHAGDAPGVQPEAAQRPFVKALLACRPVQLDQQVDVTIGARQLGPCMAARSGADVAFAEQRRGEARLVGNAQALALQHDARQAGREGHAEGAAPDAAGSDETLADAAEAAASADEPALDETASPVGTDAG